MYEGQDLVLQKTAQQTYFCSGSAGDGGLLARGICDVQGAKPSVDKTA